MTDWDADSDLELTVTSEALITWDTDADSDLETTSTLSSSVTTTIDALLELTITPEALVTWDAGAGSSLSVSVTAPIETCVPKEADSLLAVAGTTPTTPTHGMHIEAPLAIATDVWGELYQTFTDYTQVENMAQAYCVGSGRRFRGSTYGQDGYAYCPICKTTSNYLGHQGITSELASDIRFVIPDHVDPALVAEAQMRTFQFVSADCSADMVWDIFADAEMSITVTTEVNRQFPDCVADAEMSVTVTTDAEPGLCTTSADSTLPVTVTVTSIAAWDAQGDVVLLTKATPTADGPNIWHVNASMPIIATPTAAQG